ncbi:MAG: hypothetical protein AAF845_13380 [Bacteroidota bacterium]
MFEDARLRNARSAVVEAAIARPMKVSRADSVLVALGPEEAQQRAAWAFLLDIDLHRSRIYAVVMGERVPYAPDAFAGHVHTLGPSTHDWRRLPSTSSVEAVWNLAPGVALNLAASDDLSAAYLIGGAPASVRIGPYLPDDELLYDLMLQGALDIPSRIVTLRRVMAQIRPPLLPLRT